MMPMRWKQRMLPGAPSAKKINKINNTCKQHKIEQIENSVEQNIEEEIEKMPRHTKCVWPHCMHAERTENYFIILKKNKKHKTRT